ncbi:ComEC/Rec2 family competence protein [Kandleria vitulina]|uniref:ComEC/Rec2 family competence protein n=1 Tax=Kandleria vitulina TaxID=1630 RepID=UPI000490777E|nr:ComEC/Rec2 family competence protein [Kandleria vitulina]
MFIRYHLFYYALFLILVVLVKDSWVFLIFLIPYLYFFYKKTSCMSIIVVVILSFIMLRPENKIYLPHYIKGHVVDCRGKYYLLKSDYGKVKLYCDHKLTYNDEIIARIHPLAIRSPDNDHGFDERLYLKSQKIVGKASVDAIVSIKHHFSFANILEKSFSSSATIRSYQRMFLLGYKDEGISEDYKEMTSLSIVHLFALSGMHMSVLFTFLTRILSYLLSKKKSENVAKVLMGLYVFSIPYNISLYRAYLTLIGNGALKKYFNKLDVLSLLVIINLLYNPYILYSTSFLFSYSIYFVILMTQSLSIRTLYIYLSTLPIVIMMNHSINVFSFLLALLLEPFVRLFYISTLLSIFFPFLSLFYKAIIIVFQSILHFCHAFPVTLVYEHPSLFFIVMFYYLYFSYLYHQNRNDKRHFLAFLCALLFISHIHSVYKIYGEVGMINVGQGDCSYIILPFNQGNILIDTGGNKDYDLAVSTIIPFLKSKGVDHLDYVYVSHHDYDHYGALKSLKEHFPIYHVIDHYEKERQIGDLNIRMLKTSKSEDKNDNSLVMYCHYHQLHYLFTGDISSHKEEELYQEYGKLKVDVLKVSHHGSPNSSGVKLFEMIHPRIAFIGVGKHNRYGHPGRVVINRLKERGVMILRTDKDGNFCIRHYGNDYFVYR